MAKRIVVQFRKYDWTPDGTGIAGELITQLGYPPGHQGDLVVTHTTGAAFRGRDLDDLARQLLAEDGTEVD